jgi:hypothetical protein
MLHVVLVAFIGAGNAAFAAKMAEPLDELGVLGNECRTHFAERGAIAVKSDASGQGYVCFLETSIGARVAFPVAAITSL